LCGGKEEIRAKTNEKKGDRGQVNTGEATKTTLAIALRRRKREKSRYKAGKIRPGKRLQKGGGDQTEGEPGKEKHKGGGKRVMPGEGSSKETGGKSACEEVKVSC